MDLTKKIEKIEALIAQGKTKGERQAAMFAKKRLLKKTELKTIEFAIRVDSHWKKKLFVAICRKHNLQTYRYRKQKHTTTMVQVNKLFMDEELWPEFKKYAKMFEELAKEIMEDLIGKIHSCDDEEVVIAGELSQENAVFS